VRKGSKRKQFFFTKSKEKLRTVQRKKKLLFKRQQWIKEVRAHGQHSVYGNSKLTKRNPSPVFSGVLSPYQKEEGGGSTCYCFCSSPQYIQGKPRTPSPGLYTGPAASLPVRKRR